MANAWFGLLFSPLLCLAAEPNVPLDHPFTLKNLSPSILEVQSASMMDSWSKLGFAYPKPLSPSDDIRNGIKPSARNLLHYQNGEDELDAHILGAGEWRQGDDGVYSSEAGIHLSGSKSQATFLLDARMYVERDEGHGRSSFDREDVDHQNAQTTGSITYLSYSRYRGNMNWDTQVGRFTAFRDAVHWGPGLFSNLVFHQDAVPFHGFSYRANLGPWTVTSLYGDLSIGSTQGQSSENLQSRNLFAHRYELRIGSNVLLGVSDQLILFKLNKPYFFVPIFPLFLSKGTIFEESNNGNLGVDLTWRRPGLGRVYSEFILDDLESPTSLIFKDYSQNKWGWMVGSHAKKDIGKFHLGAIAEYSRIQPWVYTHFTSGTSQAANLGYPLGNQAGPNSQTIVAKGYARHPKLGYLGIKASLNWKGRDPGSAIDDPAPKSPTAFAKLQSNQPSPEFLLEPLAASEWNGLGFLIQARIGASPSLLTRISLLVLIDEA